MIGPEFDGQGELPYGSDGERTQGWSGSDASHDRALTEAAGGVASVRQRRALHLLAAAGEDGLTWKEVANVTGWHHGQVTGTLSVLHKTNHIARLRARRGKCSIYVLPVHVGTRLTAAFKPNTKVGIPVLPVPTAMEKVSIEQMRQRRDQGYATVCLPREVIDDVLDFVKRAGG